MSSTGCRSWTGDWTWTGWVVALAAAVMIVGVATPAQAKDEFEYAFKVELGRIAAHEVVYAGKHILGAALHGGHYPQGGYGHRSYGYPGHHRYYDHNHHGYGHDYGYRDHGHVYRRHGHRYGHYRPRHRGHHVSDHRSGGRAHRGRGHGRRH